MSRGLLSTQRGFSDVSDYTTRPGNSLVDWVTKGAPGSWIPVVGGSQIQTVTPANEPGGGMPGGGQCVRIYNTNLATRGVLDLSITAVDMIDSATVVEFWAYYESGFISPLNGISLTLASGGSIANRYAKVHYPGASDPAKGWVLYSYPLASLNASIGMSVTGSPNLNAINFIRIGLEAVSDNNQVWVGPITYRRRAKTQVTISIDDGSTTVYADALPLMAARNIKGNVAIPTNRLTTTGAWMTKEQLLELQNNYGWCISSHSKSHANLVLDGLTEDQKREEIVGSRQAIIDNGFTGIDVFIWPGGAYDESCKIYAAEAGYKMAADIGLAFHYVRDTKTSASNWNFPRCPAENAGGTVTAIQYVNEAIRLGTHCHIYLHVLTVAASGINTTNITEFTAMLDSLVLLRNRGLIDIVTFTEFVAGIQG